MIDWGVEEEKPGKSVLYSAYRSRIASLQGKKQRGRVWKDIIIEYRIMRCLYLNRYMNDIEEFLLLSPSRGMEN